MSNQFKFLDLLFPCGAERLSGEVVNVSVSLSVGGWSVGLFQGSERSRVNWKRKQWYVNASTNAFIMHRGLCAELGKKSWFSSLPPAAKRAAKRALALAVKTSYLANYQTDCQYYEYELNIGKMVLGVAGPTSVWSECALWWTQTDGTVFGEWREVTPLSEFESWESVATRAKISRQTLGRKVLAEVLLK